MNVKSEGKRIFGACLLLMMTVLTLRTLTFVAVAEKWDVDGSYSLVVKKEFSFDKESPEEDEKVIPDEVKKQAKDKEYTFKITGTRVTGRDENGKLVKVDVDETIVLPRVDGTGQKVWESETFKSDGPFDVTVTEITDNIVIKDNDGNYYNMSDSSTDATIPVNSRKHEVELKNNSTLTIKRPSEGDDSSTELWYRVTSRQEDDHKSDSFEPLDVVFGLRPNGEEMITKLPSGRQLFAGIYTIEQIAAPDGYQLQMGKREEEVHPGDEGHFYINGTPGKLTLTAGGTNGDGSIHYYIIDRTEKEEGDTSEFVARNISIASGESYVLDNLPKGGYTITEYSSTENANTEFSVTVPKTTKSKKTATSSAPQYTGFRTFTLTPGTTYITLNSFGPLRDTDKNTITDKSITYNIDYGVGNENGGITYRSIDGTFQAPDICPVTTLDKRYPDPNTLKIGFRTRNVSSDTAKYLSVSWTEYFQNEDTLSFEKAGVQYTKGLSVDDRGWMTITAPAPKEGGNTDQIVYYYTLRDSRNRLITLSDGMTDKENTTVKLTAGQSIKLTGLLSGSYKITEAVDWERAGFTMRVEGYPFGTTETGKEIEVQVGGQRDVIISKLAPLYTEKGAVDNRVYSFRVTGSGFDKTVEIKSGESCKVTLPEEGKYRITPQNDTLETYNLSYTDSGAVYGAAKGSSEITFTNSFSQGDYGYRFIHEYYVRETDGTYTYEGNSHITTRLGRSEGEIYTAGDIDKVTSFKDNQYTHFDEAYGKVDGIESLAESQVDLEDFEEVYNVVYPIASVSSAQRNADNDFDETYGREYSVASASSAQMNLDREAPVILSNGEAIRGEKGIVSKGVGLDSEENPLSYEPLSEKHLVDVTKDASEIIILRYYRDRQPQGTYNVIHVYYRRDDKGDTWEGTSGIIPQKDGELGIKYTGDGVEKIYDFQPKNAVKPYTYIWDGRSQYGVVEKSDSAGSDYNPNPNPDSGNDEYAGEGWIYRPNNDWTAAEGTAEGNQIIILRYYREPGKEGYYNIVHEYYFREASENQGSEADNSQHERTLQPMNEDIETEEGEDDEEDIPDIFSGTMNRNDGYVYTYEGRTGIERSDVAPLGATFTAENEMVKRKNEYEGRSYTYIEAGYGSASDSDHKTYSCNPNQQWATSTEEGNEVIILRYYREEEEPDEPDLPEKPSGTYHIVHEYYLKKKNGEHQLEGISEVSPGIVDPLLSEDYPYTANEGMWVETFEKKEYTHWEDVYGKIIPVGSSSDGFEDIQNDPLGKTYGRVPDMEGARATETGDQIIILRYIRTEPETPPPNPPRRTDYRNLQSSPHLLLKRRDRRPL